MHLQAPNLRYILNIESHLPAPQELADDIEHLSALCVDVNIVNPDFVAFARDQGLPVLIFTCNEPAQVDRAVALGVDAIFSDDPAWLARRLWEQQRPKLPTAS